MKTKAVDKAKLIAELASERKGEDIVLMDMRHISMVCDWFVLVSASSSRRVNSISKAIQKELSREKVNPLHVEGKQNPYWTLLDYEDVVVHVFYKEIREFYGLERLWSDAPKKQFNDKCLTKTSQKK
ncbi:MAG: ribosome silencing factor [Candidatus Omnitrophica bacterium]|nr:ribosome silencing factor [Candidatus Omnitrophota bacterium]